MASLTDSDHEGTLAESDEEARTRFRKEAEDLANTTRRQLYILVSAGFFLLLTLSVPDSQLVRADAEISWPLIQTEVQLTTFLSYAPLALIALAIYLHLFLERLCELRHRGFHAPETYVFVMSNLPARIVADFLLYVYVPLILAWFSWKAIFRQEASVLLATTLVVALLSAALYYFRAVNDRSEIRRRIGLGALAVLTLLAVAGFGLVAFWGTEPILRLRQIDLARADIGVTDESRIVILAESALNHADMRFARLSGANLRGADLGHADMQHATLGGGSLGPGTPVTDFENASLEGALMLNADLRNASLVCASLRDADLSQATLGATDFRGADLTGADLTRSTNPKGPVILQAATLTGARLNLSEWNEPNFVHARLAGAELDGAIFPGAAFDFADMRGTKIYNGVYDGATFMRADLTGADLSFASLTHAILIGANLEDADLTQATGITDAVLRNARLCRTTMPDGSNSNAGCARAWEAPPRDAPCHTPAAVE